MQSALQQFSLQLKQIPGLGTRILIGFCLLVFALCAALDRTLPIGIDGGAFHISTLVRLGALSGIAALAEPFRFWSAVFVHMSVLHLAFNALALNQLARSIEYRFGGAVMLSVFFVTGVGGFLASHAWYGERGLTGGASGALFGLLGMHIGLLVVRRDPRWKDELLNNLIYAVLIAFLMRVNHAAHIGGAVLGFGFGLLFGKPHEFLTKLRPLFIGVAALALVSFPYALWASNHSPLWKAIANFEAAAPN